MAAYDKSLGEKNFMALNNVIKDLMKRSENDEVEIRKMREEMNRMRIEHETLKQTVNIFKAMSMGNGATV